MQPPVRTALSRTWPPSICKKKMEMINNGDHQPMFFLLELYLTSHLLEDVIPLVKLTFNNILEKKAPDLSFKDCQAFPSMEQKELAYDLIKKMLDFDPRKRPKIEEVKCHPIFWDSKQKVEFYEKANDHFHRLKRDDVECYDQHLKEFEEHKITINNVPGSLRTEEKYPLKKCGNIHELLIMIRNMHAQQKSESSKVCLGVSEDGGSRNYNEFLESLTGPYPRLLAHLYEFLRDKSIGKPKFSTDESAKFSAEVLSHQQNHNGEIIELKSENKPSGGAGETSNTRVGTSQVILNTLERCFQYSGCREVSSFIFTSATTLAIELRLHKMNGSRLALVSIV
ncbi:serine/threonine-protein kinase/endoribonuclease IRE2-like isoform X2 [Clavelina lepadiformis]|uniref:serine/threonine-protein kinase/endoribonuclease IRE2-like isoform X2 n=1 Tax=Clavelina lepadiformis TaxID=159417 RepID=UPI0040420338